MRNRKAVSPLIATVLLIAFAVALGAVVMNWSFRYAPDVDGCYDTAVAFETVQGDPNVCFDVSKQAVRFTLNNREGPIDGVKGTIIGTVSSKETELIRPLDHASITTLEMNFDATVYGSAKKMVLRPFVERSEGVVVCQDKSIAVENIPNCQP